MKAQFSEASINNFYTLFFKNMPSGYIRENVLLEATIFSFVFLELRNYFEALHFKRVYGLLLLISD